MKLQRIFSVILITSMSVLLCGCGVDLDKVQSSLEKSGFEETNEDINHLGRHNGDKEYAISDDEDDIEQFFEFNMLITREIDTDDLNRILAASVHEVDKHDEYLFNVIAFEFEDEDSATDQFDFLVDYADDWTSRYDKTGLLDDGLYENIDKEKEYVVATQFDPDMGDHTEVYGVYIDKNVVIYYTIKCDGEDYDDYLEYADEFCDNLGISQPGSLF